MPTVRMASLPRRAPGLTDAQHVVDADDDVNHAEAGDEAAQKRIRRQQHQRRLALQQRVHRPEMRPRDDHEEEAGLDAVEREEKGDRQCGRDCN